MFLINPDQGKVNIMVKWVSPKRLYPTVSLMSIYEDKIKRYMKYFSEKVCTENIVVFALDNDYFILAGHHKMLAANRLQLSEIPVEIVNMPPDQSPVMQDEIIDSVKTIGMTALYDFEAVGGFSYERYPEYYRTGRH